MRKPFDITDDLIIHLAAEPLSWDAFTLLSSGQLSKRLQLMRHICRTGQDAAWDCRPAVDLLSTAQGEATAIVNEVFMTPCVGAWTSRCTRRLSGTMQSDVPLHVEISYLNAIAATVAMRSGLDIELPLHVRGGLVLLPGLGAARIDVPEFSRIEAHVSQGRLTLMTDARRVSVPDNLIQETADWLPLRSVSAEAQGRTLSLVVEDLDPNRDCYDRSVSPRLSNDDLIRLAELTRIAWEMLVAIAPERAGEIAIGLQSLVPLSNAAGDPGLSATSATAYGALALTIPEKPEHLGATLVHEWQHSKLSALLDLCPLYETSSTDGYFAPWKPEPRPIGGLLQGAYAFLAVADYWRRLYQATRDPQPQRYFAEHRVQVHDAISRLEESRRLTAEGQLFVSRMRDAMADLLATPVTPEVDEAAHHGLEQTYQRWLERQTAASINQSVPVERYGRLRTRQSH